MVKLVPLRDLRFGEDEAARLLDDAVKLVVKHGRDLGPVRADPGQLEQVIVNLAVNARDAMASARAAAR